MSSVFKLSSSRIVPRARALANPGIVYHVSRGQFAEITQVYSTFSNLDKLTIEDNNHQTVTQADIQSLPQSITNLCIKSRGIDKMDLFYTQLPNLETLEVRYAPNPIHDTISNLQNLKHLTVYWDTKDKPTFSHGLSACAQLETLELHTKKPIDLSGILAWLPNLRTLKISALCGNGKNKVPAIVFPDNMCNMPPNLNTLEILTKENIVQLPTNLSMLLNLKRLVIKECVIVNTHMLNGIDCIPNLKDLHLASVSSQENIVINTNVLHSLETLYIGFNRHNMCIYHANQYNNSTVRLYNPDFGNNPNLEHLFLYGDCTLDFDNFPSSISACKKLAYIAFMKLNCKIVIPDEITQLPALTAIRLPDCFDIAYMPHPDKWPIINNNVYGKCVIDCDNFSDTVKPIYYLRMSPECKCKNPYYYEYIWSLNYTKPDNIKCTCESPGLKDKETGQILTFPPDMNNTSPNIETYRTQLRDYIERHKFTYPDPHPLLPVSESASATTENP